VPLFRQRTESFEQELHQNLFCCIALLVRTLHDRLRHPSSGSNILRRSVYSPLLNLGMYQENNQASQGPSFDMFVLIEATVSPASLLQLQANNRHCLRRKEISRRDNHLHGGLEKCCGFVDFAFLKREMVSRRKRALFLRVVPRSTLSKAAGTARIAAVARYRGFRYSERRGEG
jgi:hypothetical protein